MSNETKTSGITVKKKEDFSEWYSQVITKSEFVDYTDVSGCFVFRPHAYAVWEKNSLRNRQETEKNGS